MLNKQDCLNLLYVDLGNQEVYPAAEYILGYLFDLKKTKQNFIPLSRFIKTTRDKFGDRFTNSEIFRVTQYFCGERVSLLNTKFEFIDDFDTCYELTAHEAIEAFQLGVFYHPESGEQINTPEDSIFMFFKPSEELESYLNG